MYVPLRFVIPLKTGVQFRLSRFKERETVDKVAVKYLFNDLLSSCLSMNKTLRKTYP